MQTLSASLSEQAVQEISDMILVQQRYRPGDKLPNEMELAGELGISRITLREAVRVLCTRGLLEIRRGRGTFVLPGAMSAGQPSGPAFAEANVKELFELRMALEPANAYAAAVRAADEDLEHIRIIAEKLRTLSGEALASGSRELHGLIAAAAGNRPAEQILSGILESFPETLPPSPEDAAALLRDYRDLSAYLTARSPAAACTLMKACLLRLGQWNGLNANAT